MIFYVLFVKYFLFFLFFLKSSQIFSNLLRIYLKSTSNLPRMLWSASFFKTNADWSANVCCSTYSHCALGISIGHETNHCFLKLHHSQRSFDFFKILFNTFLAFLSWMRHFSRRRSHSARHSSANAALQYDRASHSACPKNFNSWEF